MSEQREHMSTPPVRQRQAWPVPEAWPGRALGVRPPMPDELPLSYAEALVAWRMGVARPVTRRNPTC